MIEQSQYDLWFRSMVEQHCPALFNSVKTETYNEVIFTIATIDSDKGDKYRICLSTYGCELTAEIHTHHVHFDMFEDDQHDQEFHNAIDWIKGIIADEILIYTHYQGNRITQTCSAGPDHKAEASKEKSVEVFSYSGRFDQMKIQA